MYVSALDARFAFFQITIEKEKVSFSADGADGKKYAVELNLFGEIDPEASTKHFTSKSTELNLVKLEEGPYWPRLLKEKGKVHYLKVCGRYPLGSF